MNGMFEFTKHNGYFSKLNDSNEFNFIPRMLKMVNNSDGSYLHLYYFEYELKNENCSKLSGHEGYIISLMGKSLNENAYFLLNLTNGDFIRLNRNGIKHSGLTGHISDIGIGAKAGLMDDFISNIIGYEMLEDLNIMDPKKIFNTCVDWFDKSTDTMLEEIENLKKIIEGEEMVHIGTIRNPQDAKIMVDLEKLDPENIFVPSKACADMFKPTNIDFDISNFETLETKSKYRIWFAEASYDEIEEETIFIAIGNMLYAFCSYEKLAWFNKLDQEVEGYETLPCKIFAFDELTSLYFAIYKDVLAAKIPFRAIEEIALLFVACTNTEICNKHLSFAEFINEVEDMIGVEFGFIKARI